jgi:GyrI-like small molecule binding protein
LYRTGVPYTVELQHVEPRQLAAASGEVSDRAQIGRIMIGLLDQVWPVLRGQGATTGHNVVLYKGTSGGRLRMDAGVEVSGGFKPTDVVRPVSTPAGEVATVTHWGDYTAMRPAYAALEEWCRANQRRTTGVSWEVYGDWFEDSSRVRTDIFFLLEPTSAQET